MFYRGLTIHNLELLNKFGNQQTSFSNLDKKCMENHDKVWKKVKKSVQS